MFLCVVVDACNALNRARTFLQQLGAPRAHPHGDEPHVLEVRERAPGAMARARAMGLHPTTRAFTGRVPPRKLGEEFCMHGAERKARRGRGQILVRPGPDTPSRHDT